MPTCLLDPKPPIFIEILCKLIMRTSKYSSNYAKGRKVGDAGRLRKNYLFMGSEGGGKSAAIAYTLIETAKLNGADPQA
jgi:hypothetical protein